MRTTGACGVRATSAARKRCLRSCMPAVVRPYCSTCCCTALKLQHVSKMALRPKRSTGERYQQAQQARPAANPMVSTGPSSAIMVLMKVETPMQQILFCTYLVQTGTSAGTAFIFNIESNGNQVPVLVTKKHVAQVPGFGSFSLLAYDGNGGPKLGERVTFAHNQFSSLWTGHPSNDIDLAACFLARFVNNASANSKGVFFRAVPSDEAPERP